MPKIKIEKVISFSSEDSVHVANNILSNDPSKKWKCQSTGEKSASLVLQLEEAYVISSIDIGNEHSAYVEVLVSRSSSSEDFKVLLVMSSFMSPLDARQSTNINKVRMFTQEHLSSPERDEKWDRVKIVCTQPFNRHVNYGLSFITFNSVGKNETNPQTPYIGKFTLRPASPNNLTIGSIFARKKETQESKPLTAAAAIRNASLSPQQSSLNSKKIKLPKTPITNKTVDVPNVSRKRDAIFYSKDEEEPNERIDFVIKQKKEEKEKLDAKQTGEIEKIRKENNNPLHLKLKNEKDTNSKPSSSKDRGEFTKRKSNKLEKKSTKRAKKQSSKPFCDLLNGVIFVISGIQNPDRANIRTLALSMGAKYKADWDNTCTHLICAFTNTPKFNHVKGKGKIVTKVWITECHTKRKRLPWRRYALDRDDQGKDESEEEICEETQKIIELSDDEYRDVKSGSDTEDEIERIHTLQQRTNVGDCDTEDEVVRIATLTAKGDQIDVENDVGKDDSPVDGNTNSHIDSIYDQDTDEEITITPKNNSCTSLPNFFENMIFYIDEKLGENEKKMLTKYIFACNGTISTSLEDVLHVIITSKEHELQLSGTSAKADWVKPDFVYECFNSEKLISIDNFKI